MQQLILKSGFISLVWLVLQLSACSEQEKPATPTTTTIPTTQPLITQNMHTTNTMSPSSEELPPSPISQAPVPSPTTEITQTQATALAKEEQENEEEQEPECE
ncbi:MAG: hypothetical protein E6Q84_05145 [Thiothrix sp.]|nr:MAG: hypothetical protein E6Q84_05145 [Thiothrix sp.]